MSVNLIKQLNRLPEEVLGRIELIGGVASELKYHAYVVGGFVRDLLLGVADFDLDVVIEGDGIIFAEELAKKMGAEHPVTHKRFGTATVHSADKSEDSGAASDSRSYKKIKIDIATARYEIYESPGSLPKVTYGTIKDDLSRRDFSINALAFGLTREFGQALDFFNGLEDLKEEKIRVLHDLSFIDDPTRILRAIRFEQRYGFHIEPRTLKLIKEATGAGALPRVQKHRLRDEIILFLKEEAVFKCLKRINLLCGFDFIHPKVKLDIKKTVFLKKIEKIRSWFEDNFSRKRKIDLWLVYFMILVEDLDMASLHRMINGFAFNWSAAKRILSFKHSSRAIIEKLRKPISPSEVYRLLEPLSFEVIFLIVLKGNNPVITEAVKNFLLHYNGIRIASTGEDLKRIGIMPGPRYKDILRSVLYAKLDHKLKTKEEELDYLKDKLLKGRDEK